MINFFKHSVIFFWYILIKEASVQGKLKFEKNDFCTDAILRAVILSQNSILFTT